MPPPSLATDRATDKHEAILEAALALFTERGFHGTAVPLIAERAGVGAGTLYRYFDSKEALVNALYRHHKASLSGAILQDFPFDAPFRDQFHHFWQRWGQWARDNPEAFTFVELHHHASYLDEESRAVEQRLLQLTEQVIVRGQTQHAVKAVAPTLLMGIIYGAFIGIVRAARELDQPLDDTWLTAAEQCCWEAIRA